MKRKCSFNTYNDIEDELVQRAFDIDEDLPLPQDYILDEINDSSVEFLKKVEKERNLLDNKHSYVNKRIELEFSLNVNNNINFQKNYEIFNISNNWIKTIKEEFRFLAELISTDYPKREKKYNTKEIISKYKLNSLHEIPIPSDIIKSDLSEYLNNKVCIGLISHFEKLLRNCNVEFYYILMLWVYYLTTCLQTPLVDDDNSTLYNLNKNILKKLKLETNANPDFANGIISLKIIHVIISEEFGQKVVI
jgi:hypothetical protein